MSGIKVLRWLAVLEGASLILLMFVAVPLKYMFDLPQLTAMIGPIHGGLFLLFVAAAIYVAVDLGWKFSPTWKVLLASLIPFGTFYIDRKILKPIAIGS